MEGRSKARKHSMEQGIEDRLSELPESVLLYILSFMDMHCVAQTSILSKRWRNLWKSIPDMDFDSLWPRAPYRSVNFVERSLALHEGSKIRKFRISVRHDLCPAERVHPWISFLVRHNIEQLHLDFRPTFYDEIIVNDDRYETPHCIFNCVSLVSLALTRCNLNVPASMHLPSLKTLYLKMVDLTDGIMKDLISSCPRLEDLTLDNCNRCNDLNISAENSRLKSLKVIEWEYFLDIEETKLGIFAPNLLSLDFVNHMPRKSYDVKTLSSLVVASFNFDALLPINNHCAIKIVEVLDQIRHVKVLKLCMRCIVELSIREIRGSSIPVTFSVSTLLLKTGFLTFELPGLAYILRSFINLEVLIIDVEDRYGSYKFGKYFGQFEECFQDECDFDESEYWKSLETSFSDMLQHVKTVEIRGIFTGWEDFTDVLVEDVVWKPKNMITQKTKEEVLEGILKEEGNMIDFIRILLKNSAVLQTLVTHLDSSSLVFTC